MAQLILVKNKGLYTSPNEFSSVPDGAMLRANNCIITVDNIIEPRRGNDRIAELDDADFRHSQFEFYQDQHMSNWSDGNIGYLDGDLFTALSGTYDHPDPLLARTRFLLSQSNLYFTTDAGVYRLDAYNATPVFAGMVRGLDLSLSLAGGGSGFFEDQNQIAYRIVWGIRDANNTLILGAPSGRAILINDSAGDDDVDVTFTIPSGVTVNHFFQVYRSKNSGGVDVPPDDELGLIYENNPSAGELIAGTITFTDATTDDLRGATIYTAVSQEGIAQSNDPPPLAQDFEEFQGSIVYANTESKQRKTFTILAIGGSDGIAINDVITIAGTAYAAKASEVIASLEFELISSGTPAQNIADTAASLIRVINRNTTNTTVYAYYLSGPDDLPGQILIEERSLGGAAFSFTASAHSTAFNPALPTSGTSVSSSNDNFQNALMFSKTEKGEAVPLNNIRRVGSANTAIRRIKKLRNSLFIFKDREGIYRMTGTSPDNFQIDLFDSSARLLGPETVKVLNNQIWCLTDQGITIVTETGVSVVSRPIEDLLLEQFSGALDAVNQHSFGVAYETERQYLLFTVSSSGDEVATQAFVFNVFTQSYTRWPISKSAGIVSPVDGRLYFGNGDTFHLEQERKNRNYTDYVDHGTTYTLSSSDATTVYLTTTNEIEIGDLLYQSASVQSLITDVQPAYVTVEDEITWSAGDVTVFKGINCELEYSAITGQNPGMVHQFPEISLLFKAARFNSATVSFATDFSAAFEDVPILGSRTGLWGLFPWGRAPWGGTATTIPIRTYVPLEKQKGGLLRVRFTHRQGYGYFKLLGLSLPIRDTGSFGVGR